MENNMELAIVNRVKLFLGELIRDLKAIFCMEKWIEKIRIEKFECLI